MNTVVIICSRRD